MSWYDLTTDSSSLALLIPQTRKGSVRLRVDFNGGTLDELTLLVYSEKRCTAVSLSDS